MSGSSSGSMGANPSAAAPFQGGPYHELLLGLTGRWSGPTRTWFDPAAPAFESTTAATIEALLGGRWVRIGYEGAVPGKPHAGQMILGFHNDAGEFEMAWLDSFHTGTSMMLCTGKPGTDGTLSVLGSYAAGPERWGWRTVIRKTGPDQIVIEAFNISPAGEEDRAIETVLNRL